MQALMATLKSGLNSSLHPQTISYGRRQFLKFIFVIVLCIVSYLFFSRVVVTAVEVKGSSMSPTLLSGDRLLLNRFAYLHREPERGELVVLRDPQTAELVIKRIVGLPLESVQMQGHSAHVNGRKVFEPYASNSARADHSQLGASVHIPAKHFFVLGDNRGNSTDSRVFGPVPRENILGVVNL